VKEGKTGKKEGVKKRNREEKDKKGEEEKEDEALPI